MGSLIGIGAFVGAPRRKAGSAGLVFVGGKAVNTSQNSSQFTFALTDLTGGVDTAPMEGDIVLIGVGWNSPSDGVPGVVTSGYLNCFTDQYQNGTRDANFVVARKIMGASPDTSVTVYNFGNANNGSLATVHVWRGVDQTTPLDVTPTVAGGSNSRPDSPAITPVTKGAVIVSFGFMTADSSPVALTAPSGMENFVQQIATVTAGAVSGVASYSGWQSGPYNPPAFGGAEFTSLDTRVAASIALRPAA